MEWIYKSATKVLVLDRRLLEASTRDMSPEEIGLRVMCSAWARRLWTLQEGSFQSRVYYKFKDALHMYANLNKQIQKEHAFPHRRRTVLGDHFLNAVLNDPPNCQSFISPLQSQAHKALSCAWPRISAFFKEMNITYQQPDPSWLPGAQLNPLLQITVPRAIRTVMSRTTSKLDDECLVFSSLVHWWSGSAAKLVHTPAEERYKEFFTSFGVVPCQIIFLNQKRYEERGSRWIPRSLLSQASPKCEPLAFEHKITDDEYSWPNSRGLSAEYPGFSLPRGLFHSTRPFRVCLAESLYTVRVYVAGTDEHPQGLASKENLAIILPRSIWKTPWKCVGVLVAICGDEGQSARSVGIMNRFQAAIKENWNDYRDKGRILARHEALVDFSRETESDRLSFPLVPVERIEYLMDNDGNNRWRIG
jgi:hypothetical protein